MPQVNEFSWMIVFFFCLIMFCLSFCVFNYFLYYTNLKLSEFKIFYYTILY